MTRDTISISDAAKAANVLPAYLYQLIVAGRLTGTKVDGKWALDKSAFDVWREGHHANRRTSVAVCR